MYVNAVNMRSAVVKLILVCIVVYLGQIYPAEAAPGANAKAEAEPEPFFNPLAIIFSIPFLIPGT